jgi:amidohydrolase
MHTDQWVIDMRRKLHQCPEPGNSEVETTAIIEAELKASGIETHRLLETGIIGILKGEKPIGRTDDYSNDSVPRVIAFRADIDALEITESTKLPFESRNEGFMHACGHDAHTAILLAVAKELSENKSAFSDVVKFIFQPAEESTGGAERLIEAGCLENPKVDYIFGLHVMPDIPAGSVGIKYGNMYASSDMMTITINGKSGHGAFPDKAVDAIVAAAAVISNTQSVISRNVSPANPAVITYGSIHGGTTNNVIADKVVIKGTMRTLEPNNRQRIKKRLADLIELTSEAMGATAEIQWTRGYNAVINNAETVKMVEAVAKAVVGDENIVETPNAYMGGEDFSFYQDHAKGAFFGLGCGYPDRENPDLHSNIFEIDERCLKIGVEILSGLILKK